MRKLLLLSFILTLTLLNQAMAQSKTVSGTVIDQATSQGLPGVAVIVKGTSVGTATGADGKYTLNVPENATTLVFRFIGYTTVERAIGNAASIDVTLSVDSKKLQEVIVVGYGTQTKEEFTGSAASVSGDKLKDVPVQSFDQALGGRAAGVNIVQPNGVLNNPPVIRIRGTNSISLSSFPLVVLDGIPINTGDVSSTSAASNALGDINPADIESIDILKDAASTAIYGSRAAGGVLLITTKKGKSGKPRVNYEGWAGVTNATRLPDLLNAEEYMLIKNEAVLNQKILSGKADDPKVASALFFPSYDADGKLIDTDWYNEVYRQARQQNHSLSVSGGSDVTTYFFSANISDQDGFIKKNNFQRKAVRFNLDHKVNNWLRVNGSANYVNSFNSAPNTGSVPGSSFNTSGLGRLAIVTAPNVAPRNPDGSYNIRTTDNTMGRGANLTQSGFTNPLPLLDLSSFTSESDRVFGTFGGNVQVVKGVDFKTSYSIDRTTVEGISFQNPLHGDGFSNKGNATNTMQRLDNWNWINTLNLQKSFADKHNITFLVGSDIQSFENKGWGANRFGVADNFFNEYQGNFTNINPSGTYITERAFVSAFARFNYDFSKRYFMTFNFRRDGNSALAEGNKWGNFGGVSGGWALSEEGFYQNSGLSDIANSVKLRASWGRVGNGNLPSAYGSMFLYGSGLYAEVPTLVFSQAGNSELGWETSDQTNLGFDLGFLNDRIQLEFTYFNNDVNGLILSAPQSPSKGIPDNQILKNVGSMYNRGLEFAINATAIDKGKFSWSTNLNFTTIKNEVTALADGNADIFGFTGGLEMTNVTRVGYPVGSIYGVRTAGVNPENGQRIFLDKDGKQVQYNHAAPAAQRWTYMDGSTAPAITAATDGKILGNALPTWYGGFQNTFKYGNIDLGMNFTYSGGNYIYNGTKAGLRDQRFWNNHTDVLERWTPENKSTAFPRVVFGDNVSNGSAMVISENVEKADFLKLQSATLGYKIPANFADKAGISSIRVYTQVFNAFVLTKYTGADPEISTNGNSNITPGVERNSVPQGRTFTVGLNIGF
ncbi:TonB-dependent receptor [Pontibacter sp. KCTC 32443]|uniref:SusC/RagA family TonB-linked outer membrane protein n=1 Tax=Pontibacter TaxID=323449 RepID=UPI00164EB6B6|nr:MULTISPECIES: TonB-dependent receptor [Pontibacter]MBC5773830.1 TonB-dependent receptor [Pontibacter sp. KCTC 32443]